MFSLFMLVILPLITALLIFFQGLTSEYWGIVYRTWALACAGLILLTFLLAKRCLGKFPNRYLQIALLAWGLCLIPLVLLNSTSLCVGQDNGDGHNSLFMCEIYSILAWVKQSFLIVPVIFVLAFLQREFGKERT